jgi:amino acid permease
VSSVTESGTRSSGKRIGALILAIVGVLLLVAGVIYLTTTAGSLPAFMGQIKGSSGHHPLRAGTSLILGLIALAAAWWVGFGGKSKAS